MSIYVAFPSYISCAIQRSGAAGLQLCRAYRRSTSNLRPLPITGVHSLRFRFSGRREPSQQPLRSPCKCGTCMYRTPHRCPGANGAQLPRACVAGGVLPQPIPVCIQTEFSRHALGAAVVLADSTVSALCCPATLLCPADLAPLHGLHSLGMWSVAPGMEPSIAALVERCPNLSCLEALFRALPRLYTLGAIARSCPQLSVLQLYSTLGSRMNERTTAGFAALLRMLCPHMVIVVCRRRTAPLQAE
jgi:hypothetical protein